MSAAESRINIERVPNAGIQPLNAGKYGRGQRAVQFHELRKEHSSKLVSGKYNVGVAD